MAHPDGSLDDIPPLAFDSERELDQVLVRIRRDVQNRIQFALDQQPPRSSHLDHDRIASLVNKDFLDRVESIVYSNCTIAGHSYDQYLKLKRKGGLIKTQPLDETLHQRVIKYQDDLFDAREVNARERVDCPTRIRTVSFAHISQECLTFLGGGEKQDLESVVATDMRTLESFASTSDVPIPEQGSIEEDELERVMNSTTGRRRAPDAGTVPPEQAQEYYELGKRQLVQLVQDVQELSHAADQAKQTAIDAAKVR
ncbi:hypothetical protein JCM10212_000805 [Sporobolomyces blumeae]